MDWKLAEAKNKFIEVYRLATTEGPQRITKQGAEPVIVITEAEYETLKRRKPTFVEYLMSGPRIDDLELPSRNWNMRDVDL
jgi:prevent-host-death family protein